MAAASVDAIDLLVETAAHRIGEGALNDRSIDELAAELGVTARHLRRATEARLGVSPVELAQSRRMGLAKQLLQDTALPLTQIAFAAGFGSVRRFNSMFAAKMGRSPSSLRRGAPATDRLDGITLRLDYRAPYDWQRVLGFLRVRAIPGVETVGDDDAYRRVVHLANVTGELALRSCPTGRTALRLSLSPELLPVAMPLVARVRRMFDLDARPDVIAAAFRRDKQLARMIRARPGLRVPGAIDPFETAVRALLGQQISVAAAITLAGRFAAAFGAPYASETSGLAVRFPTAAEVAAQSIDRIAKIGMPGTRAAALHNLATAVASGTVDLHTPRALERFVAQLVELPGIGPWTAHYLAMRALHLPDAFPAADLGILKALGGLTPRAAEARAESWRPFRAYAVLHLWTSLSEPT
jgi:AraC family transcriptional regulator of adaptative response / DNA-3-methyladenine glycosylase II